MMKRRKKNGGEGEGEGAMCHKPNNDACGELMRDTHRLLLPRSIFVCASPRCSRLS